MDELPLFPLSAVMLPGAMMPLHIFEARYRDLVDDLLRQEPGQRLFGVVGIRQGWEVGEDNVDSMHDIGCTALLEDAVQLAGNRFDIRIRGQRRFRLLQLDRESRAYLTAKVEWLPDSPPEQDTPDRRERLIGAAHRAHDRYHSSNLRVRRNSPHDTDVDPALLSYVLADNCVLPQEDRQTLLAETDPLLRLRMVRRLLLREAEFLRELRAIPASLSEFTKRGSLN